MEYLASEVTMHPVAATAIAMDALFIQISEAVGRSTAWTLVFVADHNATSVGLCRNQGCR